MFRRHKQKTEDFLQRSLSAGLSHFWLKVYDNFIQQTVRNIGARLTVEQRQSPNQQLLVTLDTMLRQLRKEEEMLDALRSRHRIFLSEYRQESDSDIRRDLLLEFCRFLGASNLRNDKKALSRWLDENAVIERWLSRVKDREFYVAFLMGRIAAVFDQIAYSDNPPDMLSIWNTLNLDNSLTPWIRYAYEPKVQLAAFKGICSVLKSMQLAGSGVLNPEIQRYTYRFALDSKQPPELQVESLHLLAVLDINKAESVIRTRLARSEDGEQIFFKEAIAELICTYSLLKPQLYDFVFDLLSDASPLVRQSLIQTLAVCDDEAQLLQIVDTLSEDPSDAVFCQLVTQLPYYLQSHAALAFYQQQLRQSTTTLRVRALCFGLVRWFELLPKELEKRQHYLQQCEPVLSELVMQNSSPAVQYYALLTREKLWAATQITLNKSLAPLLSSVSQGPVNLTPEQADQIASESGKRWLAANIGHRFSMQVNKSRLYRGEKLRFRLWRFLYETLKPATDKRQHHSHVTGRLYEGRDFIPSATLAEVSATTVPGEPLHHDAEGHWRPFLPLVDQLISALDLPGKNNTVTLYHVSGMTRIIPPASLLSRLKARLILTRRFKYYADLRNIDFASDHANKFVSAIRALGFELTHNGYPLTTDSDEYYPVSPSVSRFFELAVPLTLLQFFQDFQRYFVSVYQNTIQHILLFTLALIGVFWGNHALLGHRIKQARRQIPVTIGGWGTRGKSGTERLKAALVNSQGLSTFSKTTGCEAMFLYSTRYGGLKEMFLFRPYDKATIWEQTFVTRLAAKLGSDALCWECMGLTPRYIDILQQQWMKDDFITLTNCFPDHEDLQGPAGIDIPQVIAKFIAPKAKVWASEENMLAYLQCEAEMKQAELHAVDWLKVATLPEDLVSRFPYQEHPNNIALVAELAAQMQMPRSWAIKEMADRVVPDIGVLQVFPYAQLAGRTMRFINGMSANERYGALANWRRLKYDDVERLTQGDFQLVTVINNRADRVPRSKVFARLIAYEFSASKHFVIGNNLSGFKTFAIEAWQERAGESLAPEMTPREFLKNLQGLMRFLLVPCSANDLATQINNALSQTLFHDTTTNLPMVVETLNALQGQQSDNSESKTHHQSVISHYLMLASYQEQYISLCDALSGQEKIATETVEQAHAFLEHIFVNKLRLVEDYYINGQQLNELIATEIPAGITTDIMGLQNIKGPGLDFVYSWQQWLRTFNLMSKVQGSYSDEIHQPMAELLATPEFGVIERHAIAHFADELEAQDSLIDADANQWVEQLRKKLVTREKQTQESRPENALIKSLLHVIEEALDIFDAVRRGRKAKQILLDLATQRISLNQAAYLLMQINKRQKGGWLTK